MTYSSKAYDIKKSKFFLGGEFDALVGNYSKINFQDLKTTPETVVQSMRYVGSFNGEEIVFNTETEKGQITDSADTQNREINQNLTTSSFDIEVNENNSVIVHADGHKDGFAIWNEKSKTISNLTRDLVFVTGKEKNGRFFIDHLTFFPECQIVETSQTHMAHDSKNTLVYNISPNDKIPIRVNITLQQAQGMIEPSILSFKSQEITLD